MGQKKHKLLKQGGNIMNKKVMKRKSILAIGLIASVFVIGAGVATYLKTPNNMIAIDINPSIELHTNRLNQVVSIDPVNEDAILLMAGYQLENNDLENVIEDIVDRMILSGYLISGQENQILITADDTNTSEEVLGRVNTAIATYLQEKQLQVELLQQRIKISDLDEEIAHENNVSAGKMSIINKLVESNSNLIMEELANMSIKELVQLSINQNISLEDLIDNYSELMEDQLDLEDILDAEDTDDADDAAKEEMQDEDDRSEAKNVYEEDQDEEDQDEEKQDAEDRDNQAEEDNNDSKEDISDNDDDEDSDNEDSDNEDSENQDEDRDHDSERNSVLSNDLYEESDSYIDREDEEKQDSKYGDYQDKDGQEEDNQYEDSQDEDQGGEDEEENNQGDED